MNQAWVRAMEIELQRQALISLVVLALLFAISMWILYLVIKAAIRDGIRESGLVDVRRSSWRRAVENASHPDTVSQMPDMRADR